MPTVRPWESEARRHGREWRRLMKRCYRKQASREEADMRLAKLEAKWDRRKRKPLP